MNQQDVERMQEQARKVPALEAEIEKLRHKIKGYRNLEDWEVTLINMAKDMESKVLSFISEISDTTSLSSLDAIKLCPDPRWLAIAKTDLQKGFMALVRAIAKPE